MGGTPAGPRVRLDRDRCCGFTLCAAYCPELFTLDEHGIALLDPDRDLTPPLLAAARRAAEACPQRVISVQPEG
jgi:ferredoxin